MKWFACAFSICLTLLLSRTAASPQNVLILDSVSSPSHQIWMHRLTRAVAERGYNITMLTFKLLKDPPSNVHMFPLENFFLDVNEEQMNFLLLSELGPWEMLSTFAEYFVHSEEMAANSVALEAVMNYPKDFKFDLIIYDYLGPMALLVLADRFPEARLMGASAYPPVEYTDQVTKAPNFSSFVPNIYNDEVKDTFSSRLNSFLLYVANEAYKYFAHYPRTEKLLKKKFALNRSLNEIVDSTRIQLANYNPVMDTSVPVMPSVIPVGGLQIEDAKRLPEDLEEIYKTAPKGVIFFSLGTNVKSEMLGQERLDAIVEALARFPEYHVIWKIDLSMLELQIPKNVFIKTWLPQNDILSDRRTKLFISHAGGLSTQEATWHGRPMLALPVMGDQFPNAAKAVKAGMALKLDIVSINADILASAIKELLENTGYTLAAQKRSRDFQDQKEKPIERALWWIEYIVRNPDVSFLKNSQLEGMNYVTKHSMDVIAFLTVVFVGVLLLLFKVTYFKVKTTKSKKQKLKYN